MQESEVDEMCSVHDELLAQAQALAADNKVSHTSILSVRGIHVYCKTCRTAAHVTVYKRALT